VGVLHGMGCRFTLDEFGASGGSLTSLRSLPLDHVKIDASLVSNLARDAVSQALVASMIRLARSLRFTVIAAGVDDAAALEAARRLGVDCVQGRLIGLPAPLPQGGPRQLAPAAGRASLSTPPGAPSLPFTPGP
jgi:EAL domain-containing protein (putative c-di-GMP-specific phosphodiesterase class I)